MKVKVHSVWPCGSIFRPLMMETLVKRLYAAKPLAGNERLHGQPIITAQQRKRGTSAVNPCPKVLDRRKWTQVPGDALCGSAEGRKG